ncbi:MAG: hypothetical protein E3K40_00520 [Candidatus Brocadia sp.]|nr:hypothetical protein [Candidatus Brocadia sp.]
MNHTLCHKIRELKNIPDAQTARNYLETFNPENVHELFRVNKEILSRVQVKHGQTSLSVTTQERVEVEYNPKKHGRPSFQSKVFFLHDNGWLINFQLCGGKSMESHGFALLGLITDASLSFAMTSTCQRI